MSDFTIIIQGPLHHHSINNLTNYLKFGKVILSCYNTDNIKQDDYPNIKIIKNQDISKFGYNQNNLYRQIFTTLNGLQLVDTKFAIKVRGDEYCTNLQPIIDKIIQYPDKYITNNVYFKKVNAWLHPSDHMIGGHIEKLKNGFECAKKLCEYCVYNPYRTKIYGRELPHLQSESILFFCWLMANHSQDSIVQKLCSGDSEDISKEIMLTYSDLVRIDDLGDFIFSAAGKSYSKTSGYKVIDFNLYVDNDTTCIQSIEEIK